MAKATADENEKQTEAPRAAPGKSQLMLVVIIAVLGTLLIGGGITGFLLYRSSGSSHAEAEQASSDESPAADEGKKSDTKKKEGTKSKGKKDKEGDAAKTAPLYIPLDPPFVVNFEASQSARFLQVTIELMTRDAATAALLKENNPLVRNDLLLLFGNQAFATVGTREGKETLRKQALDAVRGVIKAEGGKPDLLEAVYFTSFVMQ